MDTSASISEVELGRFFSEIQGIFRAGAEVLVAECDNDVQCSYPWTGHPPVTVHGRGGTRYDPFFLWLRHRKQPPDACIFLTDGHAPAPASRPPCPLLWVIPKEGASENLKFGRVLVLR